MTTAPQTATEAPQQPLVTTAPPQVLQAMNAANVLFTQAQAIVVDSPELYAMAGEELRDLRDRYKKIEAQRVYLKEPYLEGGRRIDAFFKAPLDKLVEAADLVKGAMLTFQVAEDARVAKLAAEQAERDRLERVELERQQREAAERQRQADEVAAREAREARERAAEAQRLADEEAAQANAAGDAEAAAAAQERADAVKRQADLDQAAALERQQAENLAAQQQAEEAQAAMDVADVAPPMPVVKSGAVAAGVSARKTWKMKSADKRALVIAAGKAAEAGDDSLLPYLDVNESALHGIAKALKGAARVAGVVFHEVASLAARGR